MVLGLVIGIFFLIWNFVYWAKFYSSIILLYLKKRSRFDLYDYDGSSDPEKLGIIVPKEEITLESPLSKEEFQKSADEIIFYGVSSKSEALVVRILRISEDESEAWIHLKMADGRIFYLDQTKGYQCNSDGKRISFTCGGLKMYPLCAMRRWRIVYSGMLRERMEGNDKQSVFVKFAFIWTASSEVYDTTSDLNMKGAARAMAEAKWTSFLPPVKKLERTLSSYCQSGVTNGIVTLQDEPEKEMYLFGEKIRYLGEASNLEGAKFKLILGVVPQTGLVIHLEKLSIPNMIHNLYFGFTVNPSSKVDSIQDGMIISKMSRNDKIDHNLTASFKSDKQYELRGDMSGESKRLSANQTCEGNIHMVEIKFKIDNYAGHGFMLSGEVHKIPQQTKPKCRKAAFSLQKNRPLTLYLTEEKSHLAELAGGKGSSLGKLTKLSSEMKTEFIVPKGIIVTTEAYKKFLTDEITEKIELLKNIAYGNVEGNIHEACKTVKEAVVGASLPKELSEEIESKLQSLFHLNENQVKFAVRSSATGEDTEQMSAAGQMETFLGVRNLNEILNAVKKCWASEFSYIAVEYKRQNGQILNTPMAVVIQEMVECESSGVLFTCDPVTNNPSVIVITCNYGLGESVVSGSEEPDTIILKRISNEEVEIKDMIIGLKQRKIVLAQSSSTEEGTVLQEVSEEERKECCISEQTAINLGKLSLKIENYFKSVRDIEWGMKNNKIFILQSRPVTTGEAMSDYEILHEFDGPMRSEDDFFTTCNVGEVMPKAMSPLGSEILNKGFAVIFMKDYRKKMARNYYGQSKYFFNGMVSFYNHLFISAPDILTLGSDDIESQDAKAMMMSIFGRVLDDPELKAKIKQRTYPQPKNILKPLLYYIWVLFFSSNGLEILKEKYFNYETPALQRRTSKEIFAVLVKFSNYVVEPFERHMDCSGASSMWNMHLFSVLTNAKGTIDNDVYSDFAKLLASSTNVESADVPAAMQILAESITEDTDSEKFKSMQVEEAQEWLESSQTEASKKYKQFIIRHGHRCLNEMDVFYKPWNMDPKPLIKLLQNMSGCSEKTKSKEEAALSTILPHLRVPLGLKSRLLLKFLLPYCRKGIRSREICKSTIVKTFDNLRKGFRHLSKTMVAEGYLPDAELVFFLTLEEIKDLLETRCPRTIARAKHRRKLFPLMDSFTFPEMSKGCPIPCNNEQDEEMKYEPNLTMNGIPVSHGKVRGYARVSLTLNDAANLKPGEILITRSTDVAWSPYFPILAGVVTEIGGLISHGAVVSREYGLPCVVGIQGATKHFVTGDYVLLDGNRGILQRLSLEDEK